MGCCCSKTVKADTQTELPQKLPSFIDCSSYPGLLSTGEVQVQGCAAAWPLGAAAEIFTTVQTGPHFIFSALWQSHQGLEAAKHANAQCYPAFKKHLESNNNAIEDALKDLFVDLDTSFFSSEAAPEVKAASGATGMVVYVDFNMKMAFVGRLGQCACIVGQKIGSFNQSNVECQVIAQEDPRLYAKFSRKVVDDGNQAADQDIASSLPPTTPVKGQSTPAKAAATPSKASAQPTAEDVLATLPKRGIGFGFAKMSQLTEVYNKTRTPRMPKPPTHEPYITASGHICSYSLSTRDHQLVLTTEDLLSLVTAHEATLLASDFSPLQMKMIQARTLGVSAAAAAAPGAANAEHSGPVTGLSSKRRDVNVASLIVRHAINKAMERHNGSAERSGPTVDWNDIRMMNLSRTQAKSGTRTPKGSFTAGTPGVFKLDKSLGVLVIQLDWTKGSGNSLLMPLAGTRVTNAWVKYRWQLAVHYARFVIQRRRFILDRWGTVHKDLLRKAEKDARDTEIAMYRTLDKVVQVTRTGDVNYPAGMTTSPRQTPVTTPRKTPVTTPRKTPVTTPKKTAPSTPPRSSTATPSRKSLYTPTRTSSAGPKSKQQRLNGSTPGKDPKSFDLRGGSRTPSRPSTPASSTSSATATTLVF